MTIVLLDESSAALSNRVGNLLTREISIREKC
jgi:hypothetical protein